MPSFQLIFQIIAGLGPYFSAAILLALILGLFLPWSILHPKKWLYLYIAGISLLPFGGTDPDGSGSLYKQITWGLLYALCFVIIVRSRKDTDTPKIHFPMELLLLYAFILLSISWSDYVVSSFKRYILLLGLLLISTLSSKLSILDKSFASITGKPFAVFMLCGAIVTAAVPGFAFDSDGALRAFTSHKNTWGQFMLLSSIMFFNNILAKNSRATYLPLFVISLTLLFLSKSATSLLAFFLSTSCVMLANGFSSKQLAGKLAVLALALISLTAMLIYTVMHGNLPFDALIDLVYKTTDKSSTLTGRTHLWQLMGAEVVRHPWFGTGFGGFWVGLEGPAGALVKRLDWGPPTQAHSGYIDGINEIGMIGMAFFVVVMVGHIYRCFRLPAMGMNTQFSLHLSIIICFLTINYAESSLIQGTNMWWIIMTCSIVEVYSRLKQPRQQQPQKPAIHGNSQGIKF
jgi:exopolysaccharide production protein ExoQ